MLGYVHRSPPLGDSKPKAWHSGPGFFTAMPMSFKLINLLIYGRVCLPPTLKIKSGQS